MDDRTLLEKAARAAGIELEGVIESGVDTGRGVRIDGTWWAPLHDSGDALRLAVKLRLDIEHNHPADNLSWVQAGPAHSMIGEMEDIEDEGQREAATRRAITRAAAAMDKGGDRAEGS